MAEFYSARSNTLSPPQWTSLSPPFTVAYEGRITVVVSFVLFTVVICLHFYTHYLAKEGCDLALNDDDEKVFKAVILFDKVRKIEIVKYGLFVCALLSILLIFGQTTKKINMAKTTKSTLTKGAVPPKTISQPPRPSGKPSPTPVKKPK